MYEEGHVGVQDNHSKFVRLLQNVWDLAGLFAAENLSSSKERRRAWVNRRVTSVLTTSQQDNGSWNAELAFENEDQTPTATWKAI